MGDVSIWGRGWIAERAERSEDAEKSSWSESRPVAP